MQSSETIGGSLSNHEIYTLRNTTFTSTVTALLWMTERDLRLAAGVKKLSMSTFSSLNKESFFSKIFKSFFCNISSVIFARVRRGAVVY